MTTSSASYGRWAVATAETPVGHKTRVGGRAERGNARRPFHKLLGLVALSSPPTALKGVLLLGAVVAASVVIIAFVLRMRLNGAGTMDGDAQDVMRMEIDKE